MTTDFVFLPHKTIPGAGVVAASSGVVLHRAAAHGLLECKKSLFRAGLPVRPWPTFLPDPGVVREEFASLEGAVAKMEEHFKAATATMAPEVQALLTQGDDAA